jgi:choloylglycine hydrolase
VNGRTVEFAVQLDMHAVVIPRNYPFVGKTPKGNGLAYTSKYAATGIYCFEDQLILDGINEKGLAIGAFYFPGYADYAEITKENQSSALSPVDFTNWILTQFATIEEVKAALHSISIAPTVVQGWGPQPPPFHYVVYDRDGESLVIEPVDGTLKTYDNKIGAFTNSPTFDWHLTNLNNFINLTPYNAPSLNLKGVELEAFGQGSGMVGLPGDFTPPSRFVRAALFSSYATPSKNAGELVFQAFHILNQFDIPVGAVRQKEGRKTGKDITMLTSVKDPQSLTYFFKSYEDQSIRSIELKQFDLDAKRIKSLKIQGREQTRNISSTLK